MSNIGRIFPTHSPPSPSSPPKSHSLPNSTKNFISPISSKRYEMPINLKQQTPPKSHSLPNSTKNFISPISSKRYEMPINLKQQTPQNPTHSPIQQKIS